MEKIFKKIKVGTLLNGYELTLPVHEFHGSEEGPALGLCATIHGDEDLPLEILRRFATMLEDLALKAKL